MPNLELQPEEAGARPIVADETSKIHRAFDRVTRELSDDELNSSGARKLLLERLAQAEEQIDALQSFREKFHEADKQCGILEAKMSVNRGSEAVSMVSLAVGAVILGYAPSLTSTSVGGWLAVGCGAVLVIVGVLAKVMVMRR